MGLLDATPLGGFFYDPTDDKRKARRAMDEANQSFNELAPPEYSEVDYSGPDEAGDIRVNPVAIERAGPSAYDGINVDPSYKASQVAQLNALQQLRDSGGFNAADRANLSRISAEEAAREQSQRGAIMQGAQARGMASNSNSLMAMLNANQAATNRMSQRNLDVAGMGQDRALKAGDSAATLAGNMGKQDFDRAAQVAGARDAVAKFNAQMGNQGNQFNQQQNMQAQQQNQQKTQGVYNQRSQADQSAQTMNKFTQPQAKYNAQLGKAQGLAGNANNRANWYGDQVAQGRTAQGQMWGGALQAGAAMYAAPASLGAAAAGGAAAGAGAAAAKPQPQAVGNDQTWQSQFQPQQSDYSYEPKPGGWENQFAYGGVVPGEASYYGDSPMNDTVDARLSPGEVVVPRSMTQAQPEQIGEFVQSARDPRQAKLNALQRLKNGGMR